MSGQVGSGQVRLGQVRSGQVGLAQVGSGRVRSVSTDIERPKQNLVNYIRQTLV